MEYLFNIDSSVNNGSFIISLTLLEIYLMSV